MAAFASVAQLFGLLWAIGLLFSSVAQTFGFFWAIWLLFASVAQFHFSFRDISDHLFLLIPSSGGFSSAFLLPAPQHFFFQGIIDHLFLLVPPIRGFSATFYFSHLLKINSFVHFLHFYHDPGSCCAVFHISGFFRKRSLKFRVHVDHIIR